MRRNRKAKPKNKTGDFSHLDARGRARMVDVGAKPVTARWARAEGVVHVGRVIAVALRKTGGIAKGNVLETARLAGIQAAKQTAALIPLCHPVSIDIVELDARVVADEVRIEARVTCEAKTGVEMEALTAVAVAALTVYDMCKAADKGIEIGSIRLVEKGGGKSGLWTRKSPKQERCKSGTGILPVIPSVVSHVMFIDRGQDARAARG